MKKKKILVSVLAVLLLLLTYGLGYRAGFSRGKGLRVIVAVDRADDQQPSGKAEYDPYLTRQNPIPDKVK